MKSAATSAEMWMMAPWPASKPLTRETCSAARAAGGMRAHVSGDSWRRGVPRVWISRPPTAKWAATEMIRATMSAANRNS